jgi:predicted RNase H-like HicB family nuclease
MLRQFKIVVEKHSDGYVAYPLGMKGTVVSGGDSYEDALTNIKSAIRFHIETFGSEVFSEESPLIEAFIAEAVIAA